MTYKINGEAKQFDDSMCTTTRITQGKSLMLEKIDGLTQNSNGNLEYFFEQLKELLSNELIKHLYPSENFEYENFVGNPTSGLSSSGTFSSKG